MSTPARFDNDLRYRDGDHPDQTHLTPRYVLDLVRDDLGGIGLDPCAVPENTCGADRFYTVEADGLANPWSGPGWEPSVFVNPPYGRAREFWVEKCVIVGERQRVVLLIPAATDTEAFQWAARSADAVVFVRGRLKFGTLRPNRRQHAASHPSALIGWNTDLRHCRQLGWCACIGGVGERLAEVASQYLDTGRGDLDGALQAWRDAGGDMSTTDQGER